MTHISELGSNERSLRGQTVIVTGASSGIGRAAAALFAERGAKVALVGRDVSKTAAIAAEVGGTSYTADFEDLSDVARLGQALSEDLDEVHLLVNNAGAMFESASLTADGFERTFQVNHLAPALLTLQLQSLLERSGDDVRVISTGSSQAQRVSLDLASLSTDVDGFSKNSNYGRAKLAFALFAQHFDAITPSNVAAVLVHPGFVATDIVRDNPEHLAAMRSGAIPATILTPVEGAKPLVALGAASSAAELHGSYFNRYESEPVSLLADLPSAELIYTATVQMLDQQLLCGREDGSEKS